MVELTKRPRVPFCVNYEGKEFDCLFYKKELYVCTAELARELGKNFPSKKFFILGMRNDIAGFTAIRYIRRRGAAGELFKFLSSISHEEVRKTLSRAFFR
ncbi:MAG: hypothetical protein IIY58_02195 [Aeriscardovia sp.]|nr:hypothetical protein [Aeriscardovia sp.]